MEPHRPTQLFSRKTENFIMVGIAIVVVVTVIYLLVHLVVSAITSLIHGR